MSTALQLAGRRILSVDPSAGIGAFLHELLDARGATLERTVTAAEARHRFSAGDFDLVILDTHLPDETGIDLVRDLRRADDDCVLVVLTGAGGGYSATAAMRAGADAYVEKQHLSAGGEHELLFEALAHAFEHRAGAIARRRMEVLKTDFYSMVTHDLRSPAGNVLVALKLLQSGKGGTLTAHQEQLIALATRSADKMMRLIDAYLDFAKIDAGYLRLDRAPADLAALAGTAVESARAQADVKAITITLSAPPSLPLSLDGGKVEQVLDNLLSNAIKYTPDGGRVAVSIQPRQGGARIEIQDTGVGIAADEIGRLFMKYHRVPGQPSAMAKGTGLGLLIVKEIVEAHGGQVSARSTGMPGDGTCFVVDLPADSAT